MYSWPLLTTSVLCGHSCLFSFLKFLACVPLIAADIPAVLSLDERCLGGLWTKSGYQKELESDCSDLFVLVEAATPGLICQRRQVSSTEAGLETSNKLAARDLTSLDPSAPQADIALLGVGCLWAILEEAHITTLAVEPLYQGRKLGSLLLAHLLQAASLRGLTRATLEVRASNQKALRLYQTFGFKAAGVRKRYYADGEDACILWCSGLSVLDRQARIAERKASAIAYLMQQYQQKFISTDASIDINSIDIK